MSFSNTVQRRHSIVLAGDQSSNFTMAHGRLFVVKLFFVAAFVLIVARAADVVVLDGGRPDVAPISAADVEAAPVARGKILDRNGVLLATTLKTASLFVDPFYVSDAVATAKQLAEIFPERSYGSLLKDLQGKGRFVWVARGITPEQQKAVLHIGEPGLQFEHEYQRFYPQGNLAPHLLGYTDVDDQGIAGIEKSFEKTLTEGHDLTLSLDSRLQHILRREIIAAAGRFDAVGGSGVILNAKTGEVLAGVSYPDFKPDEAGKAKSREKFNALTLGTYEFGSVFKIFSTAAFLENYDVAMSTTFDASEPLKQGRFTIRDYHAENRNLTIPEVFMHSSNIGSALMGQAVGTERLKASYKDLGLLDALDMEVPELGKPQVPSRWGDLTTLTASYGHGVAVTPLHVALGVATTVNGGTLVKPQLVKSDVEVERAAISVFAPKTSERMRALMRLVVTEGTGRKADVPGYQVGGKTGTAEKPGTTKKGYDRKRLISSFVGAFPMDDPEYVVFVAIDEPKGQKESYGYATAGWVAAPAFKAVVSSMVSVLGIPPRDVAEDQEISHGLKKFVSLKNG